MRSGEERRGGEERREERRERGEERRGEETMTQWGDRGLSGVAKNILRLETVDYRLKVFTNLTKVALTGVKEEMTALRLMTMQNRMALDLITAPQGGVCAMVGDYCCTFIPENDADGHLIDSALRNLTKLQKAMIDDGSPPPDWLTKMLSGWRELLFKIGMMIGIVLLVLAILACCVVPLVRGCIGRLVGSVVTLLQVEEGFLLDDDEEESEEEWINVIQDVKEMFKMS
ncbi:Endogenous retrovirus group FC1 [Takifugu flavidus]|uniref:Endogenous retrovirus group FC1 n=1 Tax=Takifugu flavidus TaxID=433684 RepID=A0A5C6NVT4_9TELE|nr:Endogenous retrovirus group FC1 [Takifugu flavidus]